VGLIIVLIGILLYLRKKKESLVSNNDLIKIGAFTFDIKNTKLTINNEKIELTHKESELLQLLYNNVNATVEKEFILKEVWGDEGDYVGRTLDVFISKLRKKIGPDSLVKIINVRGIGYKLVVND
jgi:DNA-binding response OmpR family regulator